MNFARTRRRVPNVSVRREPRGHYRDPEHRSDAGSRRYRGPLVRRGDFAGRRRNQPGHRNSRSRNSYYEYRRRQTAARGGERGFRPARDRNGGRDHRLAHLRGAAGGGASDREPGALSVRHRTRGPAGRAARCADAGRASGGADAARRALAGPRARHPALGNHRQRLHLAAGIGQGDPQQPGRPRRHRARAVRAARFTRFRRLPLPSGAGPGPRRDDPDGRCGRVPVQSAIRGHRPRGLATADQPGGGRERLAGGRPRGQPQLLCGIQLFHRRAFTGRARPGSPLSQTAR